MISSEDTWTITDHICAICFGRILRSTDKTRTCCSNCGIESREQWEDLCCCGIRLKKGRDAGIRCVKNPDPGPGLPAQVVAMEK